MSREHLSHAITDDAAVELLELVASCAGVSVEDIVLDERGSMQIARARHVAAWMLRAGRRSSGDVGKILGGRVYKTIAQSLSRVEAAILTGNDEDLSLLVVKVARARMKGKRVAELERRAETAEGELSRVRMVLQEERELLGAVG